MELTVQLNASVKEIYNAWLDSEKHSKMTGAVAKCSNELGGKFDIWEGYITGENMDLIENEEIFTSFNFCLYRFAYDGADSSITRVGYNI